MSERAIECHSGYTYAQRPTAVLWEGKRYEVEKVLIEWRTPDGKGFCIQTTSGKVFDLFYIEETQSWEVKSQRE